MADYLSPDQPSSRPARRYAIVSAVDPSHAGVFLVVVGAALLGLLVLGRRAGRSAATAMWQRMGLLRWVLVLIVIVIFVDMADGLPNR